MSLYGYVPINNIKIYNPINTKIPDAKTLEALIEEIPLAFNIKEKGFNDDVKEIEWFHSKHPLKTKYLFAWFKYNFMLELQKYIIMGEKNTCLYCGNLISLNSGIILTNKNNIIPKSLLDEYHGTNHFDKFYDCRFEAQFFAAQLKFKWLYLLKRIKEYTQHSIRSVHLSLTIKERG